MSPFKELYCQEELTSVEGDPNSAECGCGIIVDTNRTQHLALPQPKSTSPDQLFLPNFSLPVAQDSLTTSR